MKSGRIDGPLKADSEVRYALQLLTCDSPLNFLALSHKRSEEIGLSALSDSRRGDFYPDRPFHRLV